MQQAEGRSTVVGIFEDRAFAQRAIDELRASGFSDEQIGYAAREEQVLEGTNRDLAAGTVEGETQEETTKGVVVGGVAGGVLGAVVALLLPGIGPVLAGGVLLGILSGAAVGGAAGGLIGALMSMGIPEDEAQRYSKHVEVGRIIVTVAADGRAKDALEILRRNGAIEANDRFGQEVQPDFLASSRATDIDTSPKEPVADPSQDDSFFTQPSGIDTWDDPRMRMPRA